MWQGPAALARADYNSTPAVLDTFMCCYVGTFCGLARWPDLVHLAIGEIEWTAASDDNEVVPVALIGWQRYKSRVLGGNPEQRPPAVIPCLPDGFEELCPYRWLKWWVSVR